MPKQVLSVTGRAALAAAGAAAMTLAAFIAAPASADTNGYGDTRWVVETQGRPPFKRSRVPVSDLETDSYATTAAISDEQRRVGAPGKQRYQARPANLERVSFARFEERSGAASNPRFMGAPGKNLRRQF